MPHFSAYTHRYTEDMLSAVRDAIYTVAAELEITAWRTAEPVPFEQRSSGEELHLHIGDKWGKLFDCAWFRFRGQDSSRGCRAAGCAFARRQRRDVRR